MHGCFRCCQLQSMGHRSSGRFRKEVNVLGLSDKIGVPYFGVLKKKDPTI